MSTDIIKTVQYHSLQKFVHGPQQAETQADTMRLRDIFMQLFIMNVGGGGITFSVGQASDYQKSCADYPWFVEITLLVTVFTNTIYNLPKVTSVKYSCVFLIIGKKG